MANIKISSQFRSLQDNIKRCRNLNKVHVHTNYYQPIDSVFPQVRHFIFDGSNFQEYSQLHKLSCLYPNLETLELRQINLTGNFLTGDRLKFHKLKKFEFKYHNNEQLQQLQATFKDTNTKLTYEITPETKQ